jgi:hypothetical protein
MRPLQSVWTRAFAWLTGVPGDEVTQVIAGRLAAFGAELVALAGVYRLARRLVSPTGALYSLLSLLSTAYVLHHGFSFRADPFVVALGVWAIALAFPVVRRPRLAAATAGALLALALLVSLKAALYLVPVASVLLLAGGERRLARAAVLATSLAGTFGALYLLHAGALPPPPALGASGLAPISLTRTARTTLLSDEHPGWSYLSASVRQSPLVWLGLLGGLAVAAASLRRESSRRSGMLLLALGSTLAVFAFYRNTFPYFYLFALAPAAPLAGLFLVRLGERLARRSALAATLATATLWSGTAVTLVTHYARRARDEIAPQRQLVRVVHELFPESVPYIDRCSMIASFPKVGFFMTGWGMERYRAGGPLMRTALREGRPVFLLANTPGLWLHLTDERARRAPYALFAEDRRLLRENFVHHWGWLWVAGKEVIFGSGGAHAEFEILIPGLYTLEAPGAIAIDGETVEPGGAVRLPQGIHHARPGGAAAAFRLRWGRRLARPAAAPLAKPLFTGF